MSSEIFPEPPGIGWDVEKKPEWKSKVFTSLSGKEVRISYWTTPTWHWVLRYEFLNQNLYSGGVLDEMHDIAGFFHARQGAFDTFLYKDPYDYSVTLQKIGTGDGSEQHFQCVRTMGPYNETIKHLKAGTLKVYKNHVLQTYTTHYTVDSAGLVTFVTPPAIGDDIDASFEYYFLARFEKDILEFKQFAADLFNLGKCELVQVKD